ncbi:hypothetical protein [Microtetraspora niveoalba]|uniref:hypothetical protein n=1 Tax=Microtetraspora niveoalba TaxID=46175 RepID=UPI00082C694C|nr:hypothetical protein [Microtetraspora niveoalba]
MRKPRAAAVRGAWWPVPVVAAVAICGAVAWPHGRAEALAIPTSARMPAVARDHGPVVRTGNGKCNKNYAPSVNSPSILRGMQQVTSTSETTNTQSAMCKKRSRICRILQRLKTFHR